MTDKTIDLKTTHNSSNNFMRPQLNEDNIPKQESIRPRLLESDLNLLGNPKKTKKFTSSANPVITKIKPDSKEHVVKLFQFRLAM